jgi:hypothetical protein
MGFYFAKIADGDRHVLQEAISDALKPKEDENQEIKE